MAGFKVVCLDAKYDEDDKMVVMNCRFEETKERKIVIFAKKDLPGFLSSGRMGDANMHYFCKCMKLRGRPFNLIIHDDPKRKQLTTEEQVYYAAMFNKRINEELEGVQKGLADDRGQIQRKLGQLVDEGKLDPVALLKEESFVRGKIGGSS